MTELSLLIGLSLTLPIDYIKVQVQTSHQTVGFNLSKMIGLELLVARYGFIAGSRLLLLQAASPENNKTIYTTLSILGSTIVTPIENLLVKLQTQGFNSAVKLNSGMDAYRYYGRHFGGLFRGWDATLGKASAFALGFRLADGWNIRASPDYFSNVWTYSFQTLIGCLFSAPFDYIRVNMQKTVQEGAKELAFGEIAKNIYNSHGVLGLFQGFSYYYIRSFCTILIATSIIAATNDG